MYMTFGSVRISHIGLFAMVALLAACGGGGSGASSGSATAPGAPTAVSAIAGNASATVSFTAPANNGGAAITRYTVTSSPGGFTASGAASPINVTGLTNGTAYTFTVAATNSAGTGAASTPSNAVTPSATAVTVPGAPTNAAAIASNASAQVSFLPPANNGGAAITGYTVTSSPGGIKATGTASPINVANLTNGTAYSFTVTATNSVGTGAASAPSNSVTPSATTAGSLSSSAFGIVSGLAYAATTTPVAGMTQVQWKATSATGSAVVDLNYYTTASDQYIGVTLIINASTYYVGTSTTGGTALNCEISGTNGMGFPLCTALGVNLSRSAGTLTFTNTPLLDSTFASMGTMSGSLTFPPF